MERGCVRVRERGSVGGRKGGRDYNTIDRAEAGEITFD